MARKVASLLKKILPDNYAEKQAEFLQMEAFLKQHFKPEVFDKIRLMSCANQRVVIAAKSPTVASYLKMNQQHLESEMQSLLNVNYRILIKTNPKSMDVIAPKRAVLPNVKASLSASVSVKKAADGVDDEALQASLLKLATTIKIKSNRY